MGSSVSSLRVSSDCCFVKHLAVLQVPMDQGRNALDMITKFTRNASVAHMDASQIQLAIDSTADVLGRRSGPADLTLT